MINQDIGIKICKSIYKTLSNNGFYPALTGGLLYKDGDRKDCDIVIYRNRQKISSFELQDIEWILIACGFSEFKHFGFVTKVKYGDIDVDLFNPESFQDDDYE